MFGAIVGVATKILTEVPKIVNLVQKVQKMFKGEITSNEKHALAVELSKDAIMEMEEFSGKEIADEALFAKSLDQIISGVKGILKAVRIKE